MYCILKLENVQKELTFRRKKRRNGKFALISDGDILKKNKMFEITILKFSIYSKKVKDGDSHTILNQIENTF